MSHHIVEAVNLQYAYPDGTKAIDGITCKIIHGESVGIVGANGAGKSTMLLLLNGCLTSSSGMVRIGDFPLTDKTLKEVRKRVGTIFQDSDDQLFMPTVYDDVAFGPLNMGIPIEEIRNRVETALIMVEAMHLKDRPPYRLSGGQKKAVAIATVLSMTPDILLLDEPSSDLDPKSRRQLINWLKTFQHTKIIATHDLDLVMDVCERTIVISKGKVAADGATPQIFSNERLLEENHLEKPLCMQNKK
jgi:cobalt/nickel transport system ATP-binding protein